MSDDEIIQEWERFLKSREWPANFPPREVMAAMYRKYGPEYMKQCGLDGFRP